MQIDNVIRLLKDAPDDELEPFLKELIVEWDAKTLQANEVLKVLELCKLTGSASDLVVNILEKLYQKMEKKNGT
jgi:hypothetical protein